VKVIFEMTDTGLWMRVKKRAYPVDPLRLKDALLRVSASSLDRRVHDDSPDAALQSEQDNDIVRELFNLVREWEERRGA
jgi:hypothetical protein